MKFTKFGKALLMGVLSVAVIFGMTSCIEDYSTGYLYVTGTVTAGSGSNGIISGYRIDHNLGELIRINGLPVASGGANPVRAVLVDSSRFLYVLNRGVTASGSANCTSTDPCLNSNITEFIVGGNGSLTAEETFHSQGTNPFRLLTDGTGSHLFVLDHDAPDNANPSSTDNCALALGTLGTGSPVETCGDITVFTIDQTTGRLSVVVNAQVTAANGSPVPYFPVPANPVDFALASATMLTLSGSPTATPSFPYTGGTEVWPYTYVSTTGQLTLSQNSAQQLFTSTGPVQQGNAIVWANGVIYVLDNEPITVSFNGTPTSSQSQILPYSIGTGGALQAEPSGVIPDAPTLGNPITLMVETKGQWIYVANQGNNITGPNPESGIAAYYITTIPAYQLSFIEDEPFPSGSGPQCIVEDPSDQYIYEANEYDSTVTGRVLDPDSGELDAMRTTSTYSLEGPPTWCLINGRTN